MSPELSVLLETWAVITSQVAKKDHLEFAEHLVRIFDEGFGGIDDAEENLGECDRPMRAALISHYEFGMNEESDEEWE